MQFVATADLPDAVPRFARLQHDAWHHLYPALSVEHYARDLLTPVWDPERLGSSRLAWFALDARGRPVGVAMLLGGGEVEPDDERELSGPWFAGLVVDPAFRSQGFGAALLHHVTERAIELGSTRLRLVTETKTEFYERHGWVTEREVTLNSIPNTVMFTILDT